MGNASLSKLSDLAKWNSLAIWVCFYLESMLGLATDLLLALVIAAQWVQMATIFPASFCCQVSHNRPEMLYLDFQVDGCLFKCKYAVSYCL